MTEKNTLDSALQAVQTLVLENGARLEVFDASRHLAADRWQVNAVFRLTVPVSESVVAGGSAHLELAELRRRIGEQVVFEKRLERTFIAAGEKNRLFAATVSGYLDGALKYISRPDFARNLVMHRYQEVLKQQTLLRPGKTDANG